MKNKRKYIMVLSLILSLLIGSVDAYASITPVGEEGTLENPFTSVDYTDGEDDTGMPFAQWAASGNDGNGYYFAPYCTFKNLAASGNNAEYKFIPVYKPEEKEVTVDASGGSIDDNPSKTITVNYEDRTIDSGKEILEQEESKKLGTVLSGASVEMENYYLYFLEYDASVVNKQLYYGDAMPPGLDDTDETVVNVEDAIYDVEDSAGLYAVYSDTEDATNLKTETEGAVEVIEYKEGFTTQEAYREKFGGSDTIPYGSFSVKKELPGAKNPSYKWFVTGDSTSYTAETFTKSQVKKDMDGKYIKAVLNYGPTGNEYTLTTGENACQIKVYGRPVITPAEIYN